MVDGLKVTVLWYSKWDDSEPLGVFDSNAKAAAYIRTTYGECPELYDLSEEDDEYELTPSGWEWHDGHLVIQRFALNQGSK